jgi:hypothetical protein
MGFLITDLTVVMFRPPPLLKGTGCKPSVVIFTTNSLAARRLQHRTVGDHQILGMLDYLDGCNSAYHYRLQRMRD